MTRRHRLTLALLIAAGECVNLAVDETALARVAAGAFLGLAAGLVVTARG